MLPAIVGDTYLLPTWTFAATGSYTLIDSTAIVRLWTGRIRSATFAIEKDSSDPSISWDTGTGELSAEIEPSDWGAFSPMVDTELQIEVEITLADGVVKSFRPGVLPVREQAIAS